VGLDTTWSAAPAMNYPRKHPWTGERRRHNRMLMHIHATPKNRRLLREVQGRQQQLDRQHKLEVKWGWTDVKRVR
jgi:hypothetical protein